MKVLHVINTLAPRAGGPTVVLQSLAQNQAKAGFDVTICTTNADYPSGLLKYPTLQPVQDRRVTVWYFPIQFMPLLFSFQLKKWLDKSITSFDVVHIHGLYRFPVSYAAWLSSKACVPYVIRPHGALDPFLYHQSRHNLLLKRLYEKLFDFPNLNRASMIHYTATDEAARAAYLNLRAPTTILPNGLDWEGYEDLPVRGSFRNRIGVSKDTPLLLFLGRINFKKGLDLLVPAFAKLICSIPEAHLAIVGPDNEGLGRDVRRWCYDHRIDEQVSFVDHILQNQVREAYVDSDVFVLPSYSENFGMTVAEAMACGCPVVISDQVNIWREVEQAGAGRVVGLEVDAIAAAIGAVLKDKDAARKMGAAGRALVQCRYSWPAIVVELTKVYELLVDEKVTVA